MSILKSSMWKESVGVFRTVGIQKGGQVILFYYSLFLYLLCLMISSSNYEVYSVSIHNDKGAKKFQFSFINFNHVEAYLIKLPLNAHTNANYPFQYKKEVS